MKKLFRFCFVIYAMIAASTSVAAEEQHLMEHLKNKHKSEKRSTQMLTEQAEYKKKYQEEFSQFKAQYLKEFTEFKAKYNEELAAFRGEKISKWGEVDVSNKHKAVSYPEDDIKAVVDFESEQIVISVIHDNGSEPDIAKAAIVLSNLEKTNLQQTSYSPSKPEATNVLKNLASKDSIEAILKNPQKAIENSVVEKVTPRIDEEDQRMEQAFTQNLLAQDLQTLDILGDTNEVDAKEINKLKQQLRKKNSAQTNHRQRDFNKKRQSDSNALKTKRITRYIIKLPAKDELARVKSVSPFVDKYAKKWQLPTELVIAIIHTESSFNPNAVSFVPAYGLMQIVPVTAGVDVNDFLYKKRQPMKKDTLFIANRNIEAGTAYFHLLLNRYLVGIEDEKTRIYCAIAAYNTGVGNVAATFHESGQRSLDKATLQRINSMTPEQVLQYMMENLPYKETRKYLKKVKKRMKHYSQFV